MQTLENQLNNNTERYEKMSTENIVSKVLKEPKQVEITLKNLKDNQIL